MNIEEIMAKAYTEAQRRGVPVVRVLAEQVAECQSRLGLLPTASFDKCAAKLAENEPRVFRLGSRGRTLIESRIGRTLTDDELAVIEERLLTNESSAVLNARGTITRFKYPHEYDSVMIDGKPFPPFTRSPA